MAIKGTPRSYHKRFLFSVEIDGLDIAWFSQMSELSSEIGVVEQREGGKINVADQSPGLAKFTPVTLSVGATDNRELYDWWLQVINAAANSGDVDEDYKKNVAIVQRNRDESEMRRWNLFKAWPSKYKAGEWDATSEENLVEEVTLTFLYFDRG